MGAKIKGVKEIMDADGRGRVKPIRHSLIESDKSLVVNKGQTQDYITKNEIIFVLFLGALLESSLHVNCNVGGCTCLMEGGRVERNFAGLIGGWG